MNFPEVRAMGGSIGGMGIGAPGITTHTPTPTATTTATDPGLPPVPPPLPSPPEATPYMGFQATSALASPPAVSHPSIASMWGIGGFTTPPMPPPPPVVCPNTIASTLGIPQMPNVTYFNSRAPMGFHFRMAGGHNGIPYAFKRKPEEEPEEISKPMAKQHISEERMTAHLNSLHLSDSYCNHRLGKGKPYRKRTSSKEVDDDEDEEEDEGLGGDGMMDSDVQRGRIVIADEVKKIIPGEAQLPDSILKKLTKQSMEVVLWQPPTTILRTIIPTNIDAKIKASQNAAEDANPSPSTSTPSSNSTTTTSPSTSSSSSSSLPSTASTSSSASSSSSSSSSPDSGISISSPPPALSFLGRNSVTSSSSASASGGVGASSEVGLDLLSLPSTSSGSRGSGFPPPPLRRPASPIPDPMVEDDFSERMEFNNNNGNAPNFMWLEENNNTALIDLNAVEPQRAAAAAAAAAAPPLQPPLPEDLPDFPDSDDMDL